MSSWSPTKYQTKSWRSYNSALKRRGSLSMWFDADMPCHAAPTGKLGRQPEFSDATIQVCLTMKVLFGMPLRQTTGFVESLLRLAGLDWTGKFQTSAPYAAGLRPTGRRAPDQERSAQRLHSPWHTRYRAHRINPSGGRGGLDLHTICATETFRTPSFVLD